ncbi:MAG TPA: redoxin domain-containing protein [Blastocatellia bacterium]|nr:redoxin domain-containing protein [Blastocatellia bacterium]
MKSNSMHISSERGATTVRIVLALSVLAIAAGIVFVTLNRGKAASNRNASTVRAASSDGADTARTTAPGFALKDLSGKEVRLSDYKGKVVIVNFWATWCGPCRAEIPSFVRLRNQYYDQGLEIIGISLDEDGPGAVAGFVKQLKINYPIVMGTMETVEAYGPMDAIPTTFIIDRQGQVRSRHLGMMSFSEIEDAIKGLL